VIEDCPLVGFIGANGEGKSLVAVTECIADMRRGRGVLSTLPIACEYGESEPLVSLRQLLMARDVTVLLDEVSVLFSSRETGALPGEMVRFLQTLRHSGVTVRWTAPAWKRADVLLREVTQVVVGVRGLVKYTREGQFWPTPRLIAATAMDAVGVATDAQPEKILHRRVYLPKRLTGWGAYDSQGETPRIGWPIESGRCIDCGGRLRAESCSPARHAELGLPVVGADAGAPQGVAYAPATGGLVAEELLAGVPVG
jgi:hypothetical protein